MHDTTAERTTTEARRFAVEVIANLINVKGIAAERLLRPAGLPDDLILRFLNDRSSISGKKLTKREFTPILLDELDRRGSTAAFIDKIIEIAAQWTDYHLSTDEITARGLSQKALDLRADLAEIKKRISQEQEKKRAELESKNSQEQENIRCKQHELLLMQFNTATGAESPQNRGYLLEDLFVRIFGLHDLSVIGSFRRNDGAEQIDGAFRLDSWHYLVECRWRKDPIDERQLDGLLGQIGRSGHQTMGLFLAINGFSKNVAPLLKQNPAKRIILMDGYDLRCVLARQIGLRALIESKIEALNLKSEPFLSASDLITK